MVAVEQSWIYFPLSINLNFETAFTQCRHIFENGENCDGSEVSASVHTMPEQFENGRKFDGKKLAARL